MKRGNWIIVVVLAVLAWMAYQKQKRTAPRPGDANFIGPLRP